MSSTTPPATSPDRRGIIARIWRDYLARRWTLWPAIAFAVIAGVANGVLLGLVARSVDTLLKTHGASHAWIIVPLELGLAGLVRGLAMIGQSLLINGSPMKVTAVIQDLPPTTHLIFDMYGSARAPQSSIFGAA